MKKILLFYWGIDADDSGLRRKMDWKWFIYCVSEVVVALLGGIAIVFVLLIMLMN